MPALPLPPQPMARRGIGKVTLPQCSCMNHEVLEVTIFGTLQSNLNSLEFSLLLPDVMAIADEVDSQLTQSMESYMKLMWKSMAA